MKSIERATFNQEVDMEEIKQLSETLAKQLESLSALKEYFDSRESPIGKGSPIDSILARVEQISDDTRVITEQLARLKELEKPE